MINTSKILKKEDEDDSQLRVSSYPFLSSQDNIGGIMRIAPDDENVCIFNLSWQNRQVESSEILVTRFLVDFWSGDRQLMSSSVWCEVNLVWGPFCDFAYWIASVLILFFELMLV